MKIRKIELWQERSCNECGSRNEVEELVIGGKAKQGGSVMVIALCKECRKELYDILHQSTLCN